MVINACGEVYEERTNSGGTVGVMHLFAGSRRVVSIRSDGHEQYYHPDHLGSASIVSDETGTIQEKIEYFPFGSYRERSDYNPSFPDVNYTFTDQEEDDEVGLYNYKARLYDPVLGRFLSADSVIPNPGDLQSYNRYSYCNNNPLIYTDPSGHFSLGGLFESITESVLKATSEVSNVAGYVGDALLAAPQDAYFRSIGYGDVVDSARAGAVLGAEDGGWVGAIVGGVIGAGSAYFTNHTSAGRQTVGWVNVHVMRQGLGFGNPYVSYAGATMLVQTAASFAGSAVVWAGAYTYAEVRSEYYIRYGLDYEPGPYSQPPNGFQTPDSPFGPRILTLDELQQKFAAAGNGSATSNMYAANIATGNEISLKDYSLDQNAKLALRITVVGTVLVVTAAVAPQMLIFYSPAIYNFSAGFMTPGPPSNPANFWSGLGSAASYFIGR